MPRGDKTGPKGQGPKTGRGMGFCAGNDAPGCASGRGRGRGFGRGFASAPVELSKEEQIKILEEQKVALEKKLKELTK